MRIATLLKSLVLVGTLAILAPNSYATTLFIHTNLSAQANTTGTFEVLLTNDGPDPLDVGGFSFEISTAFPEIQFLEVTATGFTPYVFAGNSLFDPGIAVTIGQTLLAADVPADTIPATIAAGATVSLGTVRYHISGIDALGVVTISFTPVATSLADGSGNSIPITVVTNGQIEVLQGVPEPRMSLAILAALVGCAGVSSKRGRRRAPIS